MPVRRDEAICARSCPHRTFHGQLPKWRAFFNVSYERARPSYLTSGGGRRLFASMTGNQNLSQSTLTWSSSWLNRFFALFSSWFVSSYELALGIGRAT